MRIAVTGATGFLGRYTVRTLSNEGYELRAWKRASSDLTGLESAPIEWIEGSLSDADSAHELVQGVDAVVHAALERPGGARFLDSGQLDLPTFLQENLMGSLSLMNAAKNAGVGRFVFISTCAVHDVILDDRPLDETHPLWPKSHYGAHKAALEAFVSSFGHGDGWPICSLRPCGIYGLTHPVAQSKYFELVGDVVAGRPIETARGGKEVHVADVANAIALLLRADDDAIRGQAFNCCDFYVSEEKVARIAKELTGSESTISDLNRGPKNQIDHSKLCRLGFAFGGEASLRETVAQLVEACRNPAA